MAEATSLLGPLEGLALACPSLGLCGITGAAAGAAVWSETGKLVAVGWWLQRREMWDGFVTQQTN